MNSAPNHHIIDTYVKEVLSRTEIKYTPFDWSEIEVLLNHETNKPPIKINKKTAFFIDVLLQRAHMHSPNSPLLTPFKDGMTINTHSEKKRSPLSSGRNSAHGNGMQQPAAVAILSTHHILEWLKCGTTHSHPACVFFWCSKLDTGFLIEFFLFDAIDRLCLMVRLWRAVPARLRLSARDALIPQFAKCANLSWKASKFDSPPSQRHSVRQQGAWRAITLKRWACPCWTGG